MRDASGRDIPSRLAEWMQPFRYTFTAPTWHHVMVLVMGAILVPGRRTVASFVPSGEPVVIGLDDSIERRWGARIKKRGIYRDPVRSSHGHFVKASGLRW